MKKHNQEEWNELTKLINNYMDTKKWDVAEALNYLKGVLIKSAVMGNVSKKSFDKQCDHMKEIFSIMQEKYLREILECDMENPLIKEFSECLKEKYSEKNESAK